jgi:hypothetical protein
MGGKLAKKFLHSLLILFGCAFYGGILETWENVVLMRKAGKQEGIRGCN